MPYEHLTHLVSYVAISSLIFQILMDAFSIVLIAACLNMVHNVLKESPEYSRMTTLPSKAAGFYWPQRATDYTVI